VKEIESKFVITKPAALVPSPTAHAHVAVVAPVAIVNVPIVVAPSATTIVPPVAGAELVDKVIFNTIIGVSQTHVPPVANAENCIDLEICENSPDCVDGRSRNTTIGYD
jgi:hypothetical protein